MGQFLFDDLTVESAPTSTTALTHSEQLALSMDALSNEMRDIDAEFTKIAVADMGVEALDAMAGTIDGSEGGISGVAVVALSIGFEHVCNTLNYKPADPVFAATADYDDVNKRGELSVEALGKVKAIAVKVLGAIQNTVKSLIRKILTFIGNWMTNGEKIKKNADDVLETLKDQDDTTAGSKDIDDKTAGTYFGSGKGMSDELGSAAGLLDGAISIGGDVSEAATAVDAGTIKDDFLARVAKNAFFDGTKVADKYLKSAFGDLKNTSHRASAEVMGKSIVMLVNTKFTGTPTDKSTYLAKTKMIDMNPKSVSKLKPASENDISTAMAIIKGANIDKAKDLRKDLDAAAGALDKALTTVIADLRKDGKDGKVKGQKLAVNALVQLIGVLGSKPLGLFAKAASAAIAYSKSSISAMGASGDDK